MPDADQHAMRHTTSTQLLELSVDHVGSEGFERVGCVEWAAASWIWLPCDTFHTDDLPQRDGHQAPDASAVFPEWPKPLPHFEILRCSIVSSRSAP